MKGEIRPATILGPYGEGYCRACRFVIGLDENGLLNVHTRGIQRDWESPKPCKGSARRPPQRTPYASRKSAFRTLATTGECPTCRRRMEVKKDQGSEIYRLPFHTSGIAEVSRCPSAGQPPIPASVRIHGKKR